MQLTANSPFNGIACFCTAQHSTAQQKMQHGHGVKVLAFQGWQNLPGQKLAELSGGHRVGGGHGPRGF